MYVLGHEIHSFYNALFFHEFRLSSIYIEIDYMRLLVLILFVLTIYIVLISKNGFFL